MRVLLVGGGGREHALCWGLARSPRIEQLHAENITGGCQTSPLLYCPSSPNTRGQMATFLVKTFGL